MLQSIMRGYFRTNRSKPPYRVMHLASGDLWAGAEVQLYHLASYLNNRAELELLVVVLNPGELQRRLSAAGVAVKVVDESQHGFLRLLQLLLGIGRDFQPDIIHTHRQKENLLGSLVSLVLLGSRSLRTVHGGDEHLPRWSQFVKRLRRATDRWVGRWLQERIVCVSAELREALSAVYPDHKLVVIANGVDVAAVRSAATSSTLALPVEPVKVAFIGRMVPVKRIDLFVEIARLAGQQYPGQYLFYAIGGGPNLESAKQIADDYGLDNLVFTGFRKDSLRWLAAMDRLCVVSDHEGLPMVVLEAMALKVPVVARKVGGIGRVLDNGAAGNLIESADPQQFVNLLAQLSSSNGALEQQVTAAWQRVNQDFSAQTMADQYCQVYRALYPGVKKAS